MYHLTWPGFIYLYLALPFFGASKRLFHLYAFLRNFCIDKGRCRQDCYNDRRLNESTGKHQVAEETEKDTDQKESHISKPPLEWLRGGYILFINWLRNGFGYVIHGWGHNWQRHKLSSVFSWNSSLASFPEIKQIYYLAVVLIQLLGFIGLSVKASAIK